MPFKRSKTLHSPFTILTRRMIFGEEAWRQLSPAAKAVYICLKGKYNGSNNGEINLSYSELSKHKGLSSDSTISKAFKELEACGWIKRTQCGGLYRHVNKYELTWKYDDSNP